MAAPSLSQRLFVHVTGDGKTECVHRFADQRTLWGIPNALNVLSNAPFAIVGALGLWNVARGRFGEGEGPASALLFGGAFLTAFGSGYYHWAPGDETLFWDRLPMTFVFMALFGLVLRERVFTGAGEAAIRRAIVRALVAAGVTSVVVWRVTGNLRLYALVQFYPLAVLPIVLWLFPSHLSGTRVLGITIALYVVAKILEVADASIFERLGFVSGHSLKHLAAAAGTYFLVRWMTARFRGNFHVDKRSVHGSSTTG
jgi:hypothetical protein